MRAMQRERKVISCFSTENISESFALSRIENENEDENSLMRIHW